MLISIGLQNKILQAMSMKIPCIVSSQANNAIHAPINDCLLIADQPEEYVDKILRLLNDTVLYNKIAENAFRFHISKLRIPSCKHQRIIKLQPPNCLRRFRASDRQLKFVNWSFCGIWSLDAWIFYSSFNNFSAFSAASLSAAFLLRPMPRASSIPP